MITKKIRLRNLDEVHEFVRTADSCEFDVNIGYDRVMIDAKSIVGVMGLDLGRALLVSYDGDSKQLHEFCETHN